MILSVKFEENPSASKPLAGRDPILCNLPLGKGAGKKTWINCRLLPNGGGCKKTKPLFLKSSLSVSMKNHSRTTKKTCFTLKKEFVSRINGHSHGEHGISEDPNLAPVM